MILGPEQPRGSSLGETLLAAFALVTAMAIGAALNFWSFVT